MYRLQVVRGMGDLSKSQIASVASGTATTGLAAGLMAAGVVSGPVGMAIAGASGLVALIVSAFHGCGDTCVAATKIVDQIEPYLKQNVTDYLSMATPRAKSVQAARLNVFDSAWENVLNACGNAALGDAGKRCISDRQRGGKWDWFSYYRDPIANDTNVYDDSVSTGVSNVAGGVLNSVSNLVSNAGGSWIVPAALLGIGLLFLTSGDDK